MAVRHKPLWLLDIDGVINALAMTLPTDAWPEEAWVQRVVRAQVPGRGPMTLPILAARPVLDFVTAVFGSGRAEIRWHSTWRSAAVTDLAPALGLPPIPLSIAPEWNEPPVETWWKLPAAQRAIATGRRLLWTDDDMAFYRDDPTTADALAALDGSGNALLLPVAGGTGLTPADLETIDEFLRGDR